ncbi:hypothetical protein PAXINDRAFT_9076 [Paxillus involutus ATCC 200175]|nr:hypothetical protein PAXINDRAFT_9076 [Paxillus involutus ATCC 200175]
MVSRKRGKAPVRIQGGPDVVADGTATKDQLGDATKGMTNKRRYEEAESDPSCTATGSKNTGTATKNSKRGRKMATDTGGVFNNPFDVGLKSAHAFNQVQQRAHLVPVPAMMVPPHPPQTYDRLLPIEKQYATVQQQIDDAAQGLGSAPNLNLPFNSASVIQGDSRLQLNNVPIDPAIEPGLSTIMESNVRQLVISKPTVGTASTQLLPTALMQDITGWRGETPTMPMTPQLVPGPLANPFDTLLFHDPSPLGKPLSVASSASTLRTGISSPTLMNAELTPQTSSTSPEVSHTSSLAPQPSVLSFSLNTLASDKRIPPVAGRQSVLPRWLTDTVHRLESDVKRLQQKSDDAIDIVKSQGAKIISLRKALENLKLDQKKLQNDVDETLTSMESMKSNVEAVAVNVNTLADSYKTSGKSSKANAARTVAQHSKDNTWNTGVRKCFLSAIGIMKANMVKTYHPHEDGAQIRGNQIRPDFTKDWNDNACWGAPMINYIRQNVRKCHPVLSEELVNSKTDDDILKRLHENFKHYANEYQSANGVSLTTAKARSKPNAQHVHREARKRSKLEERLAVRGDSQLISAAWNYAFTLPYQSTDESVKSADEKGGVDPDTDDDRPVIGFKQSAEQEGPLKAKGKRKATSRLPWVTRRPAYRNDLFNQAMDHLNGLVLEKKPGRHPREIGPDREKDFPDVKMGVKIPLGAVNPHWLQSHPQNMSRYDASIVSANVPSHGTTELMNEYEEDDGAVGDDEEDNNDGDNLYE